jgi:hypothetical protein
MMLELCVVNLDIQMLLELFKEDLFPMVLDRYGWMMLPALGEKPV